ncbi:MAG: S9 family peptidase [Acidobacteria bacterium]|nr:S9 family peptidase [Acidobacteriota bacterium]
MRRCWPLIISLFGIQFLQSQNPALQKRLTIESIFSPGGLTGRAPEALRWAPDQKSVTFIQRDDSGAHAQLWSVDARTGEKKVLVDDDKLAKLAPPIESIKDDRKKDQITRYHVAPYYWAPDSKHLLFIPHGQLWLYDLTSRTTVQISPSPDPTQDPKFSSDGKRLAYVRAHNLHVQNLADRLPSQITKGRASPEHVQADSNILNGEVDWVYAEELSVRSNYFWSPDNRRIAFLQMDETHVPTYPITDWMPTHPSVDLEKYPKAGDPNPVVRIGIVTSSGGRVQWISLTDERDIYIPRFGWIDASTLWAEVLNRRQNEMALYLIDAGSRRSRKVLTESEPDTWVQVNDDFTVLRSKGQFLWTSWRDGHTHIYLYSYDKNSPLGADVKLEHQLTSGDFEVLSIQNVDEKNGLVYFNCNKDDPRQQQIYSVKLDGSGLVRISKEDGFHDPTFAENGSAYIDDYSTARMPNRFSVCDHAANCHVFAELRGVGTLGLEPSKYLQFKADDGTTLYGQLLLPPDSTATEIPVVVNIYGGPAAQVVVDEWSQWAGASGLFSQILARAGFAVFSVDNRGTPNRGKKFAAAIRHEFGEIELRDQVTALDQLFAQYPQLDRNRVGIWGWSNGGSMTLYALTHSDRFRAGVSVAPVSDWHDYDSIYTERYQGLPSDNPGVYAEPIIKSADKLKGALLLAHGTEDDNVHLQNSIQMVNALIRAGKQFAFMVYPNKTHSIEGPEYRIHLFHMIEDHFEQTLKPEPSAPPGEHR